MKGAFMQHMFIQGSIYTRRHTNTRAQGRIGNEKVICHVMGLGAPYRKFQSQLQ